MRPRTTGSRPRSPSAPNALAGRPPPARPGEGWPAGRAGVATEEGWLSGAGGLEACSRKLVGRAAADTLPTGPVARAFARAAASQQPVPGLLHPSDRGRQCAGDAYRALRRRHRVVAGMSRAGNGDDNAKMESFWATRKGELIQTRGFASLAAAKSEIFRSREVFLSPGAAPRRARLSLSRGL